jgi:PAS domain S-box-containing protein
MLGGPEGKAAVLEGWLDALFSTSTAAMAIISTFEGRYVRANAQMVELLDIPEAELSADPFGIAHRITHPDDLAAEQQLFGELVAGTRRSYRIEKRLVRSDGSFRWGLLTLSALYAERTDPNSLVGPLQYAVLHVIDIHEQKAWRTPSPDARLSSASRKRSTASAGSQPGSLTTSTTCRP